MGHLYVPSHSNTSFYSRCWTFLPASSHTPSCRSSYITAGKPRLSPPPVTAVPSTVGSQLSYAGFPQNCFLTGFLFFVFFIFKGIDIIRFLLNNLLRVYFDKSRKYPTSKHSPTKGTKCYYFKNKKKNIWKKTALIPQRPGI